MGLPAFFLERLWNNRHLIRKSAEMYEATKPQSQRLHQFLADMTRLVNLSPTEDELLSQAQQLLVALLSKDDWLHPELSQRHPHHPQLYLIYADPANRFSVVSWVLGPGQSTPIHDHTVWGLSGVLRGSQSCQPYSRMSDGRWVPAGFQIDMLPADVEAVSPRLGDVHKVWNPLPDQACVCIEVYQGNIGETARHFYREDGSRHVFVQGYANVPGMPIAASVATAPTPSVTVAAAALSPAIDTPRSTPVAEPLTVVDSPPVAATHPFKWVTFAQVRQMLLDKQEVALVDVREEHSHAQSHPLFAIQLSLGRIEADAWQRIPRRDTPLVLIDNGEGVCVRAAELFQRIGYSDIGLFQNGLAGWAAAGGELFSDVNVPSKAFGEWVETHRKTPSFSALEVKALMDNGSDMLVLDARRFDEFHTMSIPGAIHVPGGELVLRARTLAPKATTRIVVNCAGRTRSIIGAQSLINAGIPNPVCALRNGTIGWQLAGLALAHKAQDTFGEYAEEDRKKTAASALALLFRAGVQRIDLPALRDMQADATRTTYFMDVRTPQEYAQGHVPGAVSAPGGQLVQETDVYLAVRGARVVLCDNDGVRASMTATWLAQMGWESHVLKDVVPADFSETDLPPAALPDTIEPVQEVDPVTLKEWLANRSNLSMVIDVGDSSTYVKKHIPGAWWLLRSQMAQDFTRVHKANRYVLTCADGRASRYAVAELRSLVRPGIEVYWLPGGNASWMAQGFSTQQGESYVASPRIDKYRCPDEGADHSPQAMQAYLDWEHGLVEQLRKDGTHGFKVI